MLKKLFIFEYKYSDLKKIIPHPNLNLIASIGKLTVLIFISTDKLILYRQITDENQNEDFYTCYFKENYLIVAGKLGIIKMINIHTLEIQILGCHGSSINEIIVHGAYIFACSSDGTIGIYKDKLLYLLVGHEDVVLSLGISYCGNYLVSSGTDCIVKVWDMKEILNENKSFKNLLVDKKSEEIKNISNNDLKIIDQTIFSSQNLHDSYITNVKFLGKFIVSSSQKRIVIFYPFYNTKKEPLFIEEMKFNENILFKSDDQIQICYGNFIEINGNKLMFDRKIRDFIFKDRFYVLFEGSVIEIHGI